MPFKKPQSYQPFVKVQDISSLGRSHRVFGHKSGRTHHLLSDLEVSVFLLFEWNINVVSINEQFELSLKETLALAEEANIKHPSIKGEDKVMTSDFYITLNAENKAMTSQMALQVKYAKDLDDPRTLEKIELERRFWKRKDVPFYIITENDIPKTVSTNIKWLYPAKNLHLTHLSWDEFKYYSKQLIQHSHLTLVDFCKKCDTANNLEIGTSLSCMKAFFAHNYISFDITKDYRKLLCSEISIVEKKYHNCIIEEMKLVANQ
nr:TnsA endonuclease N-terminal domain-containing protein [Moraxella osloensis]